jgi:hypothetical protein
MIVNKALDVFGVVGFGQSEQEHFLNSALVLHPRDSPLKIPKFCRAALLEPQTTLRTVRAIRIDVKVTLRRRTKKYT